MTLLLCIAEILNVTAAVFAADFDGENLDLILILDIDRGLDSGLNPNLVPVLGLGLVLGKVD